MSAPPLPCPCCGRLMPNRPTHAGKPHYVCLECGVQLFIRGRAGIERLEARSRSRGDFWAPEEER